jgi:hypothetical protein
VIIGEGIALSVGLATVPARLIRRTVGPGIVVSGRVGLREQNEGTACIRRTGRAVSAEVRRFRRGGEFYPCDGERIELCGTVCGMLQEANTMTLVIRKRITCALFVTLALDSSSEDWSNLR